MLVEQPVSLNIATSSTYHSQQLCMGKPGKQLSSQCRLANEIEWVRTLTLT